MFFIGICLITDDVNKLASFYELILGVKAEGNDIHTEIKIDGSYLAIYSRKASISDLHYDYSTYSGYGNTTLMFRVNDVDKEYERIAKLGVEILIKPTTFPWGARAMHFRDPDGNIVDFVCPNN